MSFRGFAHRLFRRTVLWTCAGFRGIFYPDCFKEDRGERKTMTALLHGGARAESRTNWGGGAAMWRELWNRYRVQTISVLGFALFAVVGATAMLLPSVRERLERQGAEAQPAQVQPRAPSGGEPEAGRQSSQEAVPQAEWYLYITGSVRKPGVYKLPANSRLFHLVDAAGGLDGFADRVAVNLAEPLTDGLHVHVPRKGERAAEPTPSIVPVIRPNVVLHASPAPKRDGRININRASAAELEALRGIGPTLARRIVEYRQEHGPFAAVEDLVRVRGIGAAKLKGLMEQASVNP